MRQGRRRAMLGSMNIDRDACDVRLVAAAVASVPRADDHGWIFWGMTLAALTILPATRANPLLVVLGGGVAGALLVFRPKMPKPAASRKLAR